MGQKRLKEVETMVGKRKKLNCQKGDKRQKWAMSSKTGLKTAKYGNKWLTE